MFLELKHTQLDVYQVSKKFLIECYKLTKALPSEEKFNLVSQIRRAALPVLLNIAEGSSRKSVSERKRFYEVSRSSIIEVDTAIGIAEELGYIHKEDWKNLGEYLVRSFSMLSKMIKP